MYDATSRGSNGGLNVTRRWAVVLGILAFVVALAMPFREWGAIGLLRMYGYVPTGGWHRDAYVNGRSFKAREQSADAFLHALAILPWCPAVNRVVVPAMPDLRKTLARLATMDHIVAVDLADKGVTDDDLAGLAGMKNLALLDVSRNPAITDAGVANLADLKNLRYLYLAETKVTGTGFKERSDMVNLMYLSLNDCPVTDESLAAIPRYPRLEELLLRCTQVTDDGFRCLVGLPFLRSVSRTAAMTKAGAQAFNEAFLAARRKAREAGEPVSDWDKPPVFTEGWKDLPHSACQEMARDPKARKEAIAVLRDRIVLTKDGDAAVVRLRGEDTSPDMLRAIEAFPEILALEVVEASVDAAAAVHTLQRLPNLRRVQFTRCPTVTDDLVSALAALPMLHDLSLGGSPVTDRAMAAILKSNSLTNIDLSDTPVTDDGIATLAKLPTLGQLFITNTAVTDAGLESLRGHARLESLWANGSQIGDDGMRHLATCPRLKAVHARQTKLTDEGVEAIATAETLMLLQAEGTFSRRSITALATCGQLHSFLLEGDIDIGDDDLDAFTPFKDVRRMVLTGSRITNAGEARLKAMLPKTQIVIWPREQPRRLREPQEK